ncbi:MAG TPA: 50S ribosomal protein L32 [Planctomycetaceae bacterium]|nr:50S ribosomal protein L32 [Planctomycetaceae bacterium]HIQ21293.1 50S ribosomal protein L32 [Planctomycetota bacterium]
MAVPKRKHSNARTGARRAHDAKRPPSLVFCAQCSNAVPPHTVCPKCGQYMDRKVLEVEK